MKEYFRDKIKEDRPSLIVFLHAAEQDAVRVKLLVEALKAEYGDRVYIERVDVSYNHRVADEFRISAYPTWVLFKKGEELMRESGLKTVEDLSVMIQRAF